MSDLDQLRAQSLVQILHSAARARRAEINHAMLSWTNSTVLTGPFAGMKLINDASWLDGDIAPKLLGSYEAELHPALLKAVSRQPIAVVNIGCAEGYYAVGLARLLADAPVFAFDIDEKAQQICRENASANGVGTGVTVTGRCTAEMLPELAQRFGKVLFVIDCEGGETALLNEHTWPAMKHADLIVECHDCIDRGITAKLQALFTTTHQVECIDEAERNPNQYPMLRSLASLDRWLAVNENRPETMNWLLAWSQTS
jgi:precorrin-6B methylase 2